MALLEVKGVAKTFPLGMGRSVHAVADVSLEVEAGSACAIVGESGSGKSTLGRLVTGLIEPDRGEIVIDGQVIAGLDRSQLRAMRKRVTMVFQEPFQSLNPGLSVGRNVDEPLRIHQPELKRQQRAALVEQTLDEVGLDPGLASRRPADLSGGQQQRVGIARAVVTRPALIVLDEPTASLDVSVRAQIWELITRLRIDHHVAMLVITHDFETVEALCDQVVVMQAGSVVESGTVSAVVHDPTENYTRELLDARMVPPDLPSPIDPSRTRARLAFLREGSQRAAASGSIGPSDVQVQTKEEMVVPQ